MGQVTNGIHKIEITEVGTTNWRTLGYTNIDSAAIAEEEGTTTDFNVEELDTPLFSRFIPGKTTLNFDIADPNLGAFVEVFGGTIVGVGDAAKWQSPNSYTQKEFAVRIAPEIGYFMQFNRMLFKPLKNFALGKNNLTMITVNADMLQPADSNVPAFEIGGLVSPDGATGTMTAQTITFGAQADLAVAATRTLAATASSGLPVTYLSTDPTIVSVNGNVITGVAVGIAQIIATQMGNSNYASAPAVVQEIEII